MHQVQKPSQPSPPKRTPASRSGSLRSDAGMGPLKEDEGPEQTLPARISFAKRFQGELTLLISIPSYSILFPWIFNMIFMDFLICYGLLVAASLVKLSNFTESSSQRHKGPSRSHPAPGAAAAIGFLMDAIWVNHNDLTIDDD